MTGLRRQRFCFPFNCSGQSNKGKECSCEWGWGMKLLDNCLPPCTPFWPSWSDHRHSIVSWEKGQRKHREKRGQTVTPGSEDATWSVIKQRDAEHTGLLLPYNRLAWGPPRWLPSFLPLMTRFLYLRCSEKCFSSRLRNILVYLGLQSPSEMTDDRNHKCLFQSVDINSLRKDSLSGITKYKGNNTYTW